MTDASVNPYEGPQEDTSLTLLDKVREQDKDAWNRLVELYSPLLCHWCQLYRLQHADIEDVAQAVFVAVARGIGSFHRDQEGDTFRGWLRTITKTKIYDHVPPLGCKGIGGSGDFPPLSQAQSPDPSEQADVDAEAVENNILYQRAVELIESSFEPNTRRAFLLLVAGRTGKEVAAELSMTLSAVYNAKAKILRRLREEFRGLLDFDHEPSKRLPGP
jgi:RNA polymerase sigma-70 factor, ECF subfamily